MGFARAADVPVVLIGDIDRGGVIASLVGTKAVLDPEDAALIRGFIVNKFRGDPALFAAGMEQIAQATGWEALGLVPFFRRGAAAAGRGCARARSAAARRKRTRSVKIAVPILPHIANFDDLDPLEAEPAVELVRVRPGAALPGDADLVILPGSKATIADLAALRDAGFDIDIAAHRAPRRHGARPVRRLSDARAAPSPIPTASKARRQRSQGLGLLDVDDDAVGRQAARAGRAARRPTARRSPATRCIWA